MKGIIFDMDGLMFDTENVMVQAWDYAGEKLGLGKTGYMAIKTLGMNLALKKEVWDQEFGQGYDQKQLVLATKDFLYQYYSKNKVPVKKGLYPLLEYLKENDYRLAVASSSPKDVVHYYLKSAKVLEDFDVILCGDLVERSKPEPDIYLKTCELLELEPAECYVLEDSKSGIIAANAAGCKPIMVPDLWMPDEEFQKTLYKKCDSLEEVMKLLMNTNDKEIVV